MSKLGFVDAALAELREKGLYNTIRTIESPMGAWVTIEDEEGERRRYQLVGEDETDTAAGRINWRSPLGAALMKKKLGDTALVRRPAGEVEVTVVEIAYTAE